MHPSSGSHVASHGGHGPIVLSALGPEDSVASARAALAASAPKLARALLAFLQAPAYDGSQHTTACSGFNATTCDDLRCQPTVAALREAGVLDAAPTK